MKQTEKDKLKEIPNEKFEEIGHKCDDYEMDKESFLEHYKQVKAYLEANNG